MSDNPIIQVVDEFTKLALKYPPPASAIAAMQAAGLAYCFQSDTIVEAIDRMRADLPALEDHIRKIFYITADLKQKVRERHGR